MPLTALIDGDLIAYINAASAENDEARIALLRADRQMRDILDYVNADKYKLYLSGGTNFRYGINPQYKANRVGPEPIHRKATHNFLIREWNAIETDGYEADDALGCEQNDETVICSLDKDLLMIPGRHYSWPIMRKGKIVRDHTFHDVSYIAGLQHFYKQMLIGDTADNIIGVAGIGKVKAHNTIINLLQEDKMYNKVLDLYQQEAVGQQSLEDISDDEYQRLTFEGYNRFIMNADCLWIWRSLGINFTIRGLDG